jgi:hypothetical protein
MNVIFSGMGSSLADWRRIGTTFPSMITIVEPGAFCLAQARSAACDIRMSGCARNALSMLDLCLI